MTCSGIDIGYWPMHALHHCESALSTSMLLPGGRMSSGSPPINLFDAPQEPAGAPAGRIRYGRHRGHRDRRDHRLPAKPLVAMTQQNHTVQVSLSALQGGYVRDYPLVLSGARIPTLPILVVFALMGRQILGGLMQGAVKG
jgi:hypothetical protein